MVKADFVASLVFLALGLFMIEEGARMPGAGGLIEAGGEPGKVPILLGAILAVLALALLVRTLRRGDWRPSFAALAQPEPRRAALRALATGAGCAFYAVGLVGANVFGVHIDYEVATALFVFAFILIAEWPLAPQIAERRWRLVAARAPWLAERASAVAAALPTKLVPRLWLVFTAALQAVLVALVVTYVFRDQFLVTLP